MSLARLLDGFTSVFILCFSEFFYPCRCTLVKFFQRLVTNHDMVLVHTWESYRIKFCRTFNVGIKPCLCYFCCFLGGDYKHLVPASPFPTESIINRTAIAYEHIAEWCQYISRGEKTVPIRFGFDTILQYGLGDDTNCHRSVLLLIQVCITGPLHPVLGFLHVTAIHLVIKTLYL